MIIKVSYKDGIFEPLEKVKARRPARSIRCSPTKSSATSARRTIGPGFFGTVDENSRRYCPFRQRAMGAEPQQRGGFQDNCGTDKPARTNEERTHAGDD